MGAPIGSSPTSPLKSPGYRRKTTMISGGGSTNRTILELMAATEEAKKKDTDPSLNLAVVTHKPRDGLYDPKKIGGRKKPEVVAPKDNSPPRTSRKQPVVAEKK